VTNTRDRSIEIGGDKDTPSRHYPSLIVEIDKNASLQLEITPPTMKNIPSNLPPELQSFASLLDVQPPTVQEAFQFLLATAMHEAGKFELVSVTEIDGRWHYTFNGAGEVFSVGRAGMSKELERRVRETVREILGEERTCFELGKNCRFLDHRQRTGRYNHLHCLSIGRD